MDNILQAAVAKWSVKDVTAWLYGIDKNVDDYVAACEKHKIEGWQLLDLTWLDLLSMGIDKIGRQQVFLSALNRLRYYCRMADSETLQNLLVQLEVSCGAFARDVASRQLKSTAASRRLPVDVVRGASTIADAVRHVALWISRPPFNRDEPYKSAVASWLSMVNNMLFAVNQKDAKFTELKENLIEVAEMIESKCQGLRLRCVDYRLLETRRFMVANVQRKRYDDDLGLVYRQPASPSDPTLGPLVVARISVASPGESCGQLCVGDEIIQVNSRVVVGWRLELFEEQMRLHAREMMLTVLKLPLSPERMLSPRSGTSNGFALSPEQRIGRQSARQRHDPGRSRNRPYSSLHPDDQAIASRSHVSNGPQLLAARPPHRQQNFDADTDTDVSGLSNYWNNFKSYQKEQQQMSSQANSMENLFLKTRRRKPGVGADVEDDIRLRADATFTSAARQPPSADTSTSPSPVASRRSLLSAPSPPASAQLDGPPQVLFSGRPLALPIKAHSNVNLPSYFENNTPDTPNCTAPASETADRRSTPRPRKSLSSSCGDVSYHAPSPGSAAESQSSEAMLEEIMQMSKADEEPNDASLLVAAPSRDLSSSEQSHERVPAITVALLPAANQPASASDYSSSVFLSSHSTTSSVPELAAPGGHVVTMPNSAASDRSVFFSDRLLEPASVVPEDASPTRAERLTMAQLIAKFESVSAQVAIKGAATKKVAPDERNDLANQAPRYRKHSANATSLARPFIRHLRQQSDASPNALASYAADQSLSSPANANLPRSNSSPTYLANASTSDLSMPQATGSSRQLGKGDEEGGLPTAATPGSWPSLFSNP